MEPGTERILTPHAGPLRRPARRICRCADTVGRERVLAGVDCGFGTYAGRAGVSPSVVRAKLAAPAEGAGIAAHLLWRS